MAEADPHLAELERLLKRDERGRPVGSSFAAQRLAPQVLAPPPEPADHSAHDLDPLLLGPEPAPRWMLAVVAVAAMAGAGLGGWWLWSTLRTTPAAAPPVASAPAPAPAAPPAAAPPPPAVPALLAPPVVETAVQSPPAPPGPARTAVVPPMPEARPALESRDDLVAPDTAGLSPARKVRAQVIRVEGDREVTAGR
jgi:hypothetical protein